MSGIVMSNDFSWKESRKDPGWATSTSTFTTTNNTITTITTTTTITVKKLKNHASDLTPKRS